MPKREFVMLAKELKNEGIGGWFWSVKMDGQRALWDGGITRGMPASSVPFANTEKDSRLNVEPISTGLWSRYGKVIRAPDWFLNQLPKNIMLDGELYCGRNSFQKLRSIVADHNPSKDWLDVSYHIFDLPSFQEFSLDEPINNPNFSKRIFWKGFDASSLQIQTPVQFIDVVAFLKTQNFETVNVKVHSQIQLPYSTEKAVEYMNLALETETDLGGEGIMLRKPESIWTPVRSNNLLKVKKLHDDEAVVVGYVTGRATDRGSKLLGMMGSMIVEWKGKTFQLSGFTDEERALCSYLGDLTTQDAINWAKQNPETVCPNWVCSSQFPRGSKVTFRYRELTDDGIPKEARFWRKHAE